MKTLLAFLSATLLSAATTVVISPKTITSTQAVIRIQTDQDGNCTFRASEGTAIGMPVNDVDTTKFNGSNSDARPGSIVGPAEHFFVLGTRTAARASDGKWYSRALQANTQHTLEVSCGADVVTQPFTTRNPPLGDIAGETMPFDSSAPYNAALPTIDMTVSPAGIDTGQSARYIDPLTGLQIARITGPMQGASNFVGGPRSATTAFDTGSSWTTPANAPGTSGFATTGAAGAENALFIPFNLAEVNNYIFPYGEWVGVYHLDDMNYSINGSGSSATVGDRQMSACLTLHHGAACDSDTFTLTFPQTTPSVQTFPGASATTYSPTWKLWTAANPAIPAHVDLGTRTGTATMSGTTITWASGALFSNRLISGDRIMLKGSTCSNGGTDYCTVASVTDSKHIVTVESNTVASPAAFTVQNAGIRIWKNNGAGTVSINTAKAWPVFGLAHGGSANQQKDLCSPNTFPLTANRDGTPRTAVTARLCQFQANDGGSSDYIFIPSTGEAWHIANGATTYPGPGPRGANSADQIGSGGKCATQGPVWDPIDPFSWYCNSGSGVGPYYQVVLHFKYNYVAGAGSCNGREWNDSTYGSVLENPCVSIVNDTPASLGQDLIAKYQAAAPTFDPAYFDGIFVTGGFGGYMTFSFRTTGQDHLAYLGWYNVVTKNFVKVADTFRSYPMRWAGDHGNSLIHNTNSTWSLVLLEIMSQFRNAGDTGGNRSEMSIVSIAGKAGTDLPSNYFTACPAGLDPRWLALGAPGNNCVQITMDGEPRLENPSAKDKAKWPASPLNPSWSQIQTVEEGDEITDQASDNFSEHFLVVKKTAGAGNQIVLDLMRNPKWPEVAYGPTIAHATGWVPYMTPSNRGAAYWVNVAGNAPPIPEMDSVGCLHVDSSGIGPNGGIVAAMLANRTGGIPPAGNPLTAAGSNASYFVAYTPAWNGSDPANWSPYGAAPVQSHNSSRQVQAPLSEQGWVIDGHPYGGTTGANSSPICTLGSIALQAGTTSVYKLTLTGGTCPATLDLKNFPLEVTFGRFLGADISSASTGNIVTDATSYKWCYARAVNECRAGAAIGDIYAAIPFGETTTPCSFSVWDINAPCVFSKYGEIAQLVQANVTQADPTASGTRKLGYGLTVPTHASNYWSGTTDPEGEWVFFSPLFADNMNVNQFFAYKLPPTPPRDDIARNGYVNIPLAIGNAATGDAVRVRFGYAEFGPVDGSPNSLYCTSRAETCYTSASPTSTSPFVFAAEPQSYIACDANCAVNVPALSNHVLYYTFERKNGSDVSTSPVQAVAVP
jgi:hypothetical protein